ncbi:hypothetical protein Tco_1195401 [Tanacetum coccineum]
MSSLDRSSTTVSDLYKGLNVITQLLKEISNAVKDDPATNQKINEATETFTRISSNVTENLGSTMSGVELSQTVLKREISSLRKDTFEINVTPTLALTDIQVNVEGENANITATEEPPSHTEGETEESILAILISSIPSTVIPPTQAQPITSIIIHTESSRATPKIDKGKGIATESDDDPSKKLVKASSIVRPDPDEPIIVEFIINRRTVYLIEQEIQDYWGKEEQIKKAKEEARFLAMTKPKIHPKTKPMVITVYRGTDGRNFDVHKPFLFRAFGISELDELREIIPKKKNTVSALSAPEQTLSQVSRRKRKHMELEPETRIPGLECN